MSNRDRPSPGLRFPVFPSGLALLLMLGGAAGFIISLVLYNEQVLCQAVSIMLVFVGLGLRLSARRNEPDSGSQPEWGAVQPKRRMRLPVERAMRARIRRDQPAPVQAAPQPRQPEASREALYERETVETRVARREEDPEKTPPRPAGQEAIGPLARQVVAIFRGQNAWVDVEASREERCILRIRSADGQRFVAMVLEDSAPADTAETRALYALMNSHQSVGAFLVTGGGFTERATEWARERGIQLTGADQLEDLVL